jgi:hypothetical protein
MLTVARASEEGKKSICKTLCMFIDRSVYGRIGNKNCSNLISNLYSFCLCLAQKIDGLKVLILWYSTCWHVGVSTGTLISYK